MTDGTDGGSPRTGGMRVRDLDAACLYIWQNGEEMEIPGFAQVSYGRRNVPLSFLQTLPS